jgi:type I restriction enzyme S subunit
MSDKYLDKGVPFLRSLNVRPFRFSADKLLFIDSVFHKEIYKSRLDPGDLAIVRSGAPGTTCVIPKSLGQANCSDLVIARPSERLVSEFGCIFMNSEVAKKNVAENQVGVAQQHFNVSSMKKMPIQLPSREEQTEIVRRVDQLFVYADTIETQVNNAMERVNNLTQSILAKAFRGELTEQWRKDNRDLISGENSASALLENIKADRAASKPVKRGRKKA